MLLQIKQAQTPECILVGHVHVNGPGSSSPGITLSLMGNEKALFKLNVENKSMEKAEVGVEVRVRGPTAKKREHVTGV